MFGTGPVRWLLVIDHWGVCSVCCWKEERTNAVRTRLRKRHFDRDQLAECSVCAQCEDKRSKPHISKRESGPLPSSSADLQQFILQESATACAKCGFFLYLRPLTQASQDTNSVAWDSQAFQAFDLQHSITVEKFSRQPFDFIGSPYEAPSMPDTIWFREFTDSLISGLESREGFD